MSPLPPRPSCAVPALRRTLRLSVVEGMLHAVMLGVSESYLGALAVELGHRDRALALLATVPLLAGALSQFTSGWLVGAVGGRKRVVVGFAALQAVAALAFFLLATLHVRQLFPFLAIKIAFWSAGAVIVPAWSAWMGDLTAHTQRSRYFATRSAWISVALVVSFALAGWFLHVHAQNPLEGYAWLFAVAFVARALSALALALQLDTPVEVSLEGRTRFRESIFESRWQVALYMASLMFATHVATPFFTPYMLRVLHLDYGQFAVLMSAAIIAKSVVFPLCHPLSIRLGMRGLLLLSGLGVGLTPWLWYVARTLEQLFIVELFAGAVWAAWEFTTFQLLLSASPERHRLAFFSLSGTLTACAQLAGALFGTALIEQLQLSYRGVFLVSSGLRLTSLVVLLVNLRRLLPSRFAPAKLWTRLESVRPNAGGVTRLLRSTDRKSSD